MVSIDSRTRIGLVELRILNLGRSIEFYQRHVGLALGRREGRRAWLGAGGADLLALVEGDYLPKPRGTTGLYHFAILVPTRTDLARSLRRFVREGTVMQGFADHGVSEALYLADPDGNGIEVYRDRPREEWPRIGESLQMVIEALDVDDLLGTADDTPGSTRLATGTTVGHVHLHVADLRDSEHFYVNVLGFDIMQRFGPGALFVSAGGYHHHIGLNTWAGIGAPAPPERAIGLDHFVVVLPDGAAARDEVGARIQASGAPMEAAGRDLLVRDPSGNRIRFVQSASEK